MMCMFCFFLLVKMYFFSLHLDPDWMDVLLDGYEQDLFWIQRLLSSGALLIQTNCSVFGSFQAPSLWWNTIIHQSRVPPKNTEAAIRGMNLVEKALVEPWPWSSSTYRRSACGQNRRNLDVEMKKKKQKTWEISRDCNRLKAELCGFSNFSKRGVEEPLIDALIRWQWFGHREKSRRFIQMAINQ